MFHSTSPEGDTSGLKGMFALNAHQAEANRKHIECASIVCANGYTTISCDKMAYVDVLAVLAIVLLCNCTRLRLKHE